VLKNVTIYISVECRVWRMSIHASLLISFIGIFDTA
jgi:hypothetical protein